MMTEADFLVKGLDLPPLEKPVMTVDTHCAITGVRIERGYRVRDIVPKASSEFHDLLALKTGYVSEAVGIAWKGSWNLGSRLIFEDGTHYHPLIDPKAAAKQGRPAWRDLVRDVYPARKGQRVLSIISTDFKKRVWPYARLGNLGHNTAIYLLDESQGVNGMIQVDWAKLIVYLSQVEILLAAGFSRQAIAENLLRKMSICRKIGLAEARDMEILLGHMRSTPEFKMVWTIARQEMKSEGNSIAREKGVTTRQRSLF